jgi:putative phosphoesterase
MNSFLGAAAGWPGRCLMQRPFGDGVSIADHREIPEPNIVPRVGLISDTHGLLRPEALTFLRGSEYIVHAGDIGDPRVITELSVLAPVTAVRGNNDRGVWAQEIPEAQVLQVDNVFIYILHNVAELNLDPVAAGFQVVVSGHSHQPSVEERNGVLYVNPGSCGPRRFKLPITAAELDIEGHFVTARVVELELA